MSLVEQNKKAETKRNLFYLMLMVFGIVLASFIPIDVYADIKTSIKSIEEPALDLAKAIGGVGFLLTLIVGAGFQYFGQEFSSKGKLLWLTSIFATLVIYNATDIRDWFINTFS